jgi:putative endopeptidase
MKIALRSFLFVACAVALPAAAAERKLADAAAEPAAATTSPGAFDAGLLDKTADPCVDFYQFACGGWRKANPIPPDQTRWGRFNELAERNREVPHDILERVRDAKPGRSPLEARVGDYYAACMDEAGIEERGTKPLDPILARVEAVASKQDLFRLLGDQ